MLLKFIVVHTMIIIEKEITMKKTCIFDLDGTLTDTLESLTYSVNGTLEELGLKPITSEQCRAFVGDGARCLIERALIAAGDEQASFIEQAMQIYKRIFKTGCMYNVKPYDGIVETLLVLKQSGVKLAVLSNKPHEQTCSVVYEIFGRDLFDWVQGQQENIPRKPSPEGIYYVLDKLCVEKTDTAYVGDSDVDMRTGKSAGLLTIGVSWGFRDKEVLEQCGADHIIGHAKELLDILQ